MLTRENGEIIPQHWRGGTWQKTGDGNPLQVEQHIKTEENTFEPISDGNPQPVKIMNSAANPVPITTSDTFDVNVTNETLDINVTNATINTKITNMSGEPVPVTPSGTFNTNVTNTVNTKITNTTGEPVPVQPVLNTSRVTLFTGLEIRDTNPHLSTSTVEPDKYKIVLFISNSLNQPVDVSVYSVMFADVINRNGTEDKITVAPYSTEVITDLVGIIEPISEQMKIQLKATNAPASGNITVYAYLTNRY